jgi:phosphoribosylformylglycinamidine synthase
VVTTAEPEGINFILPKPVKDKEVSVIEVGPFNETSLAEEINKFLGTNIEQLTRINTYLLVHPPEIKGLDSLLTTRPFVDPVVNRASLNKPLTAELELQYNHVLQSMLNPGTSDAEGTVALRQALLALGHKPTKGDKGFYSKQYFLKGDLSSEDLEAVSAFLANPELNIRKIIPRDDYESGTEITVPIVTLKPEVVVEKFNITNMSDQDLLILNTMRKIAANLEELHQFRDMYLDQDFIQKRKEVGLDEKATDVEIETWFGLRSEHCFHKEANAYGTLEDKVNDPIFKRAFEKGWLRKDKNGNYVLEDGLFKTFIEAPAKNIYDKLEQRGKNWIASMFEDNSGVAFYNEKYMFCIKFETHNSPSQIEPIQGAKTGIDGVNRDIFGTILGTFDAIANFFFYCTGDPKYRGWLPKGVKYPYTLVKGVTQGVREGGNEMQIPTLGGGIIADQRYSAAKCNIFVGTVGWSEVKSATGIDYTQKHPAVGDLVFVAGQPVGIDGVHGATESSLSASEDISLGHVQADFSFIQAKLKEYLLSVARDGLLTSITDFGAMGLGSASHETAEATGGLDMDLALHPKKYEGIQPWQINASETQDRMLLVSKPETKDELLERAELHEVEVTELGELTDSGYVNLKYDEDTVALIDIEKLFNKEPRKRMHAVWNPPKLSKDIQTRGEYSLEESLCLVMSQPDVASKEWFFRQKDSSVKGATVQGPLIGLAQEVEADATIQKPLDTEGEDYGAIAYSSGISPKLSDIDAYYSAQKSFIDMIGKIIAIGGALPDMETAKWDAWAVCGNYCQPNSDSNTTLTKESGEHNLASFWREGIAIREAEEETNIPVISGKDSMKCSGRYEVDKSFKLEDVPLDLRRHINLVEKDNKRFIEIHDPDTYLASAAVKIQDYRKCVNSLLKEEGDLIYVIGTTKNHLGASQFSSAIGYEEIGAPFEGGLPPEVDFNEFIDISKAIHAAVDQELVASCSYLHNGGLYTALAKAAMAGQKGALINTTEIYQDGSCTADHELLYSETPGRFIVTIAQEDKTKFERIMNPIPFSLIGTVTNNNLHTINLDSSQEQVCLTKVKEAYQAPLRYDLDVAV